MSDKDTYYYSNGKRIPLDKAEGVVAVKEKAENEFAVSRERIATGDQPMLSIPYYGIHVIQKEDTERFLEANASETTEYQNLPVFKQSADQFMIATTEFFAKFQPDVTLQQIEEMNERFGVRIVEELSYGERSYKLEIIQGKNTLGVVATANAYFESGQTVYAQPNFIKKKQFRKDPTIEPGSSSQTAVIERGDNYLSAQWHLHNIQVIEAWNLTKGAGTTIAIIDNGVEEAHPEFKHKIVSQYNFTDMTNNGNPKTDSDRHGTAVAGVAAAQGVKAYGSAPECKIIAIRMPDFLGSDREADMFKWAADQGADVINCSWGPPDGLGSLDPLPDPVREAIHYAIEKGRGGRGVIVCWAAGNGNESVSLDGYASNPEVIAVAACTDQDQKADYSDFGKEIWITAPSNGGVRGIVTTDRLGQLGYNKNNSASEVSDNNYTNQFGGTSSASPLVAGVACLMLSVNPNLSWKQVMEIMAKTADKIGDSSSYSDSPLGPHSEIFGYGRINALKAVQEAKRMGAHL